MFHDPNQAVLALTVGMLGITFEFHAPGSVFPGVVGATLVLLSAASLLQYTNRPMALFQICAAFVLFILELKLASRGILATLGALSLTTGIYMLIGSAVPSLLVFLSCALIAAILITVAASARLNKAVIQVARQGPNNTGGD